MKTTTLALAFALLFSAGCAGAQALQDPTRPPAAAAAGYAAASARDGAAPRLQSVLIGRAPGGRHLAVIDGETVGLGGDFHGARVARIGEHEVELVRGRERRVLRLYANDTAGAGVSPVRRAAMPAAADHAGALAAQR